MEISLEAELSEPQRLAFAYAPLAVRPLLLPLLALDARLGSIVRRASEPMLAQMRLAWWRDTLDSPRSRWPAGEPILARLASWQSPDSLAALAEGWEHLLADRLDESAIAGFAAGRQAGFAALAGEMGTDRDSADRAARTWALADLAANLSNEEERSRVVAHAGETSPLHLPSGLRPLAVLAALGRRSLRRGGRPLLEGRGAAATAFRVGLFGR